MSCVHRFIRDVSNPDQQNIMAFSARGLYSKSCGQLYSAATFRQCQFVTVDVPTTHSGVRIVYA